MNKIIILKENTNKINNPKTIFKMENKTKMTKEEIIILKDILKQLREGLK